jgi:hypothetical protein
LRVDGKPNPLPTAADLTPPQAATIGERTWVIYIPRGNAAHRIEIAETTATHSQGRWFDPRTGRFVGEAAAIQGGRIPARPDPPDEDWVLLIQ